MAQPCRSWAVIEDMALMAATASAVDFHAGHENLVSVRVSTTLG